MGTLKKTQIVFPDYISARNQLIADKAAENEDNDDDQEPINDQEQVEEKTECDLNEMMSVYLAIIIGTFIVTSILWGIAWYCKWIAVKEEANQPAQ